MIESSCKTCGKIIDRRGSKAGIFCNLYCKGAFQSLARPVSVGWLKQKYLIERLGCYEIAKLVSRNPKQVFEWLKYSNIPTRSRKQSVIELNKRPQIREARSRSSKGRALNEEARRKISIAASRPKPNLRGKNNGMFGRRGKLSPMWNGGFTPDRQRFYASITWQNVKRRIWKRDLGTCQKCLQKWRFGLRFHIHHIITFCCRELRRRDFNLVVLCEKCHRFVHSLKNMDSEGLIFMKGGKY